MMLKLVILSALLLASFPGTAGAQSPTESAKPDSPLPRIAIPEGTPIPMRFAQAIWGLPLSPFISDPPRPPFQKGDTVRLVAAADVLVDGQLVVRKGSPGQATVIKIRRPERKNPDTGIELQWDWIKTIDDQQLALKPFPKRKWKTWYLDVYADHGGFFVNQTDESLVKGIFEAMTFQYMAKGLKMSLRQKLWVPAGTRVIGYVQTNVSLDTARLAEAQARLPLPNSTALLTIYRMKGQKDRQIDLACDDKPLGQLGARQYFMFELQPGIHSCRADKSDPLEFAVSAGRDYYLNLQFHTLTNKWTMEQVDSPVGEDGIGEGELITPQIAP
jgi:hypothetical protein